MNTKEINNILNIIAHDRCKEIIIKIYKENGYIEESDIHKQIYYYGFMDGIKAYEKAKIS